MIPTRPSRRASPWPRPRRRRRSRRYDSGVFDSTPARRRRDSPLCIPTQKKKKPAATEEGAEAAENDDAAAEDDADDAAEANDDGEPTAAKKKKKKRSKKKKPTGTGSKEPLSRLLGGFTDSYVRYGQTEPPTIPVSKLFKADAFPVGEIQDYEGGNAKRVTDAEKRSADRMQEGLWNKVRHASEVHRQVRRYAQSFIKPGLSLTEMCEKIEQKNRDLVEESGL